MRVEESVAKMKEVGSSSNRVFNTKRTANNAIESKRSEGGPWFSLARCKRIQHKENQRNKDEPQHELPPYKREKRRGQWRRKDE